MNEFEVLYGMPCVIAKQIKRQKKTSRYRLINWLYEKMYGYEYESTLPDGTDIIKFDGKLIFRDKETYDKVVEHIQNMGL
jgi:hypothetical protein